MEDPDGRFWPRVAAVAPLVGMCTLAAAALTAQGFDETRTLHAGLHLCWCMLVLVTGLGFCLRWRLTGEAAIGLLGTALVVWSLPQLPFALADVASDPEATWRRLGPMTRMTVLVPAAWLLLRCVRTPPVDSTLRPARDAVGFSLAAAAAAGALVAGQMLSLVAPASPSAMYVAGCLLAVTMLVFAWLFAHRATSLAAPANGRAAVAFGGLGLGATAQVVGMIGSPLWAVLGEFLAVASAVVLMLLALSLLRSAVDFFGLRMLALRLRADSAEDSVRREEERLHEARSTVAGIRQASGALGTRAPLRDLDRERDLQQLMAAELTRLERLLGSDWRAPRPGPVMLDDLIRPLVVAEREYGTTVSWRPTGACALADADAVTEALGILLTNARVHAPGAPVEIVVTEGAAGVSIRVHDHGPGVPPDLVHSLFARGTRGGQSPGHGFGLHIARDLLTEAGGELRLVPVEDGGGACFALTLPSVAAPAPARAAGPLEDGE